MRTLRGVLAVACLAAALPAPLAAQGPFIDWINKMSGPELQTYGLTYRFPDNKPGRILGYNAGQRLEEADRAILREGLRVLRNRNATSALRCMTDLYVAASAWESFHEASADTLRHRIRHVLADRLVSLETAAQDAAVRAETENLACRDLRKPPPDPGAGLRFRLKASVGRDRQNVDRIRSSIYAFSPQFTTEVLVGFGNKRNVYFGLEAGVAGWLWFGDFRRFTTASFPIFLNYHPFASCSSWLLRNFRLGSGFQYFADIDERNFGEAIFPEVVGGEWIWTFFVSVDFSRSSFRSAPRLGCGP